MSIRLTLVFNPYPAITGPVLAYDKLHLDTNDETLFTQLRAMAGDFTPGLHWYDDEKGIVETRTDQYDIGLTSMPAYLVARYLGMERLGDWDRAVLSMIMSLPPRSEIILYWH